MLEAWKAEYGDPFLVHALNGPVVMTGREDLIREIHGTDPDCFEPFAMQTILPILGPGTIFAMQGMEHRRERKLLTPMFHGDRMRAYGESMCSQSIQYASAYLGAGELEVLPMMVDVSFGIIVQNIIGGTSEAETRALVDASQQMIRRLSPILFFSRAMHFRFWGYSPWDRFEHSRNDLFEMINKLIAERRSNVTVEHDDILSLLCRSTYEDGEPITDSHIRDELITFLFAGHETTALSLAWAMYHLHGHPDVLSKLRLELDGLDGSPPSLWGAPYLKACIQETLRIHPIVTETLRKLKSPIRLGEFTIPAGYAVSPATVLAHYNESTFPNADRFLPERFLDKSYSPFTYMPFGGGHRRCIGAAFANYEMAMVLGTLLRRFEFQLLVENVQVQRRNVTMGPSSNIPMKIRERSL